MHGALDPVGRANDTDSQVVPIQGPPGFLIAAPIIARAWPFTRLVAVHAVRARVCKSSIRTGVYVYLAYTGDWIFNDIYRFVEHILDTEDLID